MRYAWFARPNELMFDLDGKKALKIFRSRSPRMEFSVHKSDTPNHWHAFGTFHLPLTPVQHARIAVAYGSDPKREAANLDRARNGAEFPIALFRKDKPEGWRKPDLTCNCPWEISNKKTGKMEKLHACVCIRTLRGHRYQAALKSNSKRITQKELKQIISGWIRL